VDNKYPLILIIRHKFYPHLSANMNIFVILN